MSVESGQHFTCRSGVGHCKIISKSSSATLSSESRGRERFARLRTYRKQYNIRFPTTLLPSFFDSRRAFAVLCNPDWFGLALTLSTPKTLQSNPFFLAMIRYLLLLLIAILSCATISVAEEPSPSDEEIQYFERKIRPILAHRCYSCHSSDAKVLRGGLRLDTAASVQKGGDSGPTLVAGQPDESLLIHSIQYDSDIQMPPKGRLPDVEIKELTEWVKRGPRPSPALAPPRHVRRSRRGPAR